MDEQQKERVTQWVAALRSGEYQQAQEALRILDEIAGEDQDAYFYCCLGVACQISSLGKWNDGEYRDQQGSSDSYLPPQVTQYYGLTHEEQLDLTHMNDEGIDFATIADFIEQKFLKQD